MARVKTEEEIEVAMQNKDRQVIIAQKAKESTEAVEAERVDRKRLLEKTEKEKLVELANIEKEKQVEVEKKNIQTVIRERVTVEKDTVTEEEKIKDTRAFAQAERTKAVALRKAEEEAESEQILKVKAAEAEKAAAEKNAEKKIIDADAALKASQKEAESIKVIADARVLEESASGIADAKVIEARALAQAKGEAAMVEVKEKDGTVEAEVLKKKYMSEAEGIKEKASSMKLLDEVGKEHEEFKLKLDKEKSVELASINIQKDIAEAQATVIREALKSAKIDIVGGETMFFDKIIGSIANGKSLDRLVGNSEVLGDLKETLITGDPEYFKQQISDMMGRFNLTTEDIKNLTISGAIGKMMHHADKSDKAMLDKLLNTVHKAGVADLPAKLIESTLR